MHVQPQSQHHWLMQLVGDWEFEAEVICGPGQPVTKSKGTESVRALGSLWILAEGKGLAPDGVPTTTVMTLGYDMARKRIVGTWIGSMMDMMWLYDGELNETGNILTLNSDGPNMQGDGTAKYQDVIEFLSGDHRTLSGRVQAPDGTWNTFMTTHYRRTRKP